ncbi:MAG: sigma-54 dependent transcriptional regulator [Desulfobacterales bacterium]|nr:sigma-54 dependent transcriptional regulator [Desulfobacterales bacterium]
MVDVLIIDDDLDVCKMLSDLVRTIGYTPVVTNSVKGGLNEVLSKPYDIVFLDVMLPDGNGLELLPQIKDTERPPEVIIMTGEGSSDGAEIAVKNGAWDYLEKPVSPKKMILSLRRVVQYREDLFKAKIQNPVVALKTDGIIGSSPQMRASLDSLAHAANSEANVLVVGETGTEKELFARAIHFNSPRTNHNFVTVDCAALPDTLIESSLFGYEKGAFTGADKPQTGLIKQADGGTLFLDEIGELGLSLQKAFLRVLQERRFRPLGSKKEIESNFRLVAATNRDLDEMVKEGFFRKDLLYRLRSITIELPPLRKHQEDIKELALYYVTKICESYGTEEKKLSPDLIDALYAYQWPGNVRELVNALEGAISEARYEPTLFPKHLQTNIRIYIARSSVHDKMPDTGDLKNEIKSSFKYPCFEDFKSNILSCAEKEYLKELVTFTKGSIKDAVQISGMGRTWLFTRMKKYEISRLGWPFSDDP